MTDNDIDKVLAETWYILDGTAIYFRQPPTIAHMVCISAEYSTENGQDLARARARVIAAAPEALRLLAALTVDAPTIVTDSYWRDLHEEARALLAALRDGS